MLYTTCSSIKFFFTPPITKNVNRVFPAKSLYGTATRGCAKPASICLCVVARRMSKSDSLRDTSGLSVVTRPRLLLLFFVKRQFFEL